MADGIWETMFYHTYKSNYYADQRVIDFIETYLNDYDILGL